jgi:hypothetical protein
MNNQSTSSLLAAVLSLAAFAAVRGAEPAPVATPSAPVAAAPDAASARWTDIKDTTFELRARFFTGFERLEARLDGQISELKAKRATMKGTTGTKEWDFAMKEMDNAHAYLSATGKELAQAGPDSWDQVKDRVGQAWVRAQDAYKNVKSSTTN